VAGKRRGGEDGRGQDELEKVDLEGSGAPSLPPFPFSIPPSPRVPRLSTTTCGAGRGWQRSLPLMAPRHGFKESGKRGGGHGKAELSGRTGLHWPLQPLGHPKLGCRAPPWEQLRSWGAVIGERVPAWGSRTWGWIPAPTAL